MKYNQAILAASEAHLGLKEWPGAKHNPAIVAMFEASGAGWVPDDETPWCAAFVNSVLAELGLPGTSKVNARSFEKYGTDVPVQQAQPGDICVFWRGSPNGWQGHVAFLIGFEGSKVRVRGGNQGNKVSDALYSMDRLISIQRVDGVSGKTTLPTLRKSPGYNPVVKMLQELLHRAGCFAGEADGYFGQITENAVRSFQAREGMSSDGIVGSVTWEALKAAKAPVERTNTETALTDSRSLDRVRKATVAVGGIGMSTAVSTAKDVAGVLPGLPPTVLYVISGICVIAAIAFVLELGMFRREDHATGKHLGR